ncbi:phage tail sheath subtilisin-like domain-containing protein [Chitinibacter fontanus]|uniref:Phage tail sheath subtilisin-like domain-containing protein n=1 Tax=Chitinibacter fontanus TaxID=1737446 RepID=A0A7D5V8L6_9NEIS|nr:phage tail sheath subtilisin-like domain-containing protein [Chitinibacter fontanus]QLI80791.1 phage tail sheath subtilisin-like domain-containing protein [Chitinibacter fontanus]
MTVPFNQIAAALVPLFYAEMDNSAANAFVNNQRALLIGQKLAAGSAAAGVPILVGNLAQAKALFGVGSMLARMYETWRKNDLYGEVWCLPIADNAAGVQQTGTITFTGNATAAGTHNIYIAGQRVQAAVAVGDTPTIQATAFANAITAAVDLPVTATPAAGVVTWTCKWKGATGADIQVGANYRGQAGGETTPGGVTVAFAAGTAGATDPLLSTVISALGDDEFDWIVHPYTDSANLDAIGAELNDVAGRWSWTRQVYGHVYSAKRGSLATLVTFGQARNDPHHTIAPIEPTVPTPCWEFASAFTAQNASSLRIDPARPTQTLVLQGVLPAPVGGRWLFSERQSLLTYGLACCVTRNGAVAIDRAVTTYQKNSFGQADGSYRDSETLFTSAYVLRRLRYRITQKFPRHKLADDGTRFSAGAAIVTPGMVRGELIDEYDALEYEGIVENSKLFAKNLIVERNATDPNRLDVLFPPDYINQLRVFAVLNQFRLQYAGNA